MSVFKASILDRQFGSVSDQAPLYKQMSRAEKQPARVTPDQKQRALRLIECLYALGRQSDAERKRN